MLTDAHMGGMDEMGLFYDACLEQLYPPGSCGMFCNEHTYNCYLTEIQAACCDEQVRPPIHPSSSAGGARRGGLER